MMDQLSHEQLAARATELDLQSLEADGPARMELIAMAQLHATMAVYRALVAQTKRAHPASANVVHLPDVDSL